MPTGMSWHTLTREAVEQTLATGDAGLGDAEVRSRQARYGLNELPAADVPPWWRLALRQFTDPLIYVLLAAAVVTVLLRDVADTIVILLVLGLNGSIGLVQERKAHRMVRSLAKLSPQRARVVRHGTEQDVAVRELVPGDVVLLASGARIPADLRVVAARELAVDEAPLTGESEPVEKMTDAIATMPLGVSDQRNMAFAGTTVTRGRGRGVVVRIGPATELGSIAGTIRSIGATPTPLQMSVARLGKVIGGLIAALGSVLVAIGLLRSLPLAEILLTAVAMAVSAVPEGLPVVLTITLAVGVRRMAARRAIIRSLPAVETLGSTTVIASDKTGTLTQDQMTVRAIWADGITYEVTGTGYSPAGDIRDGGRPVRVGDVRALLVTLEAGIFANEADAEAVARGSPVGDPSEIALVVAAMKGGASVSNLRRANAEVDALPFESERRLALSLRQRGSSHTVFMKGAPEAVLARCAEEVHADGSRPVDRARVLDAAAAIARDGRRVLAMAYRPTTESQLSSGTTHSGFVFAGLVGLEDPVRPEAAAAIAAARSAGIRVLMLTGDHIETARAVGARLGLGDRALAGAQVSEMTDDELDRSLTDVAVYARVAPEHKLRIVQRLKERGEVVAVTGDGVNDAPALRAAHLGIAMGATGSDVAREASDMILADDNFATITSAIEEGRLAFSNVRRVTFFLLSSAAGEILAILAAAAAGIPIPFTAAQILWINLVTDSVQALALAFERADPDALSRQPRPRHVGLLEQGHVLRLGTIGALLAGATLVTFLIVYRATGDLRHARSVATTQMVALQLFHLFNCRSLDRSAFRLSLLSNRFLLASVLATVSVHVTALYAPPLQRLLQTTPASAREWLVILGVASVVLLGGEVDKLLNRRAGRHLG